MLIRNAAAIMTGLPGAAARAPGGDLRIDQEGRISAIGRLEKEPGERVIDATDCVVYPGWINTHHHLAQSVLKGVPQGINLPLLSWLESVPYRYRARFDAEVRSLIHLDHPHVVRVLDAGAFHSAPYVVLQYLGGGSLATRLAGAPDRRLRAEDLLPWLRDAAAALDFMHAQGIVHRDVKPENLLRDEAGTVYLADFGIAKALGGQTGTLTQSGWSPGTPAYMAPEQALGEPVTGASDQYALAVTAYVPGSRPANR